MPLTDSMEKPPAPERTAGPIAVFFNSYARLPEHFFARRSPTPVAKPRLIKFNESLAAELGVDTRGLEPDDLAAVFAGNVNPLGAEPIAMAYAGDQFGNFVPRLGDGRAILLGEVVDRNGERRDVQLKGAGRTPFSRRGDGRAALGPVRARRAWSLMRVTARPR
jgi:serine/tyrosine/threonine adenylyltransferase